MDSNTIDVDDEHEKMEINPRKARFPYCIVWTPLPVLSWFIPFIGHIGICREDGVILDFAGPNFVCVDNFAFGSVTRYIQIDAQNEAFSMEWDDGIRKSTQEFQHRSYDLFTCNCHSFVANNLNRLGYGGSGWNVVNLAVVIFVKGRWVSKGGIVKSFLPFVVLFGLGLMLGGWTFFIGWALFMTLLVGWFLLGTYVFKNLVKV